MTVAVTVVIYRGDKLWSGNGDQRWHDANSRRNNNGLDQHPAPADRKFYGIEKMFGLVQEQIGEVPA